MDLNVKSLFFLTQALHGPLKAAATKEQPGKVINIASIDGIRINPWETYSYQASKAAVIQLTKRMATRLIKDSINVTGIAPGAFASEMNKAARDFGDAVGNGVPSGRTAAALGEHPCVSIGKYQTHKGSSKTGICQRNSAGQYKDQRTEDTCESEYGET